MFGLFTPKRPASTYNTTLEMRIRDAVGELHRFDRVLIVLEFDAEHTRRALAIHNPHGHVTVLCEPQPGTHFADCFIVDGDEIRDDPHGMSVWPVADEHFMAQFKGKPAATVSYFPPEAHQ